MFKLKKTRQGLLQIHARTANVAFEGTPARILVEAVRLGVWEDDLFVALNEMEDRDHDFAEFGALGRLVYTGLSRVS